MLSILEECRSSPIGGTIVVFGLHIRSCKNAHDFAQSCYCFQIKDVILMRQEFPKNPILVIELLDVWVIDFMVKF